MNLIRCESLCSPFSRTILTTLLSCQFYGNQQLCIHMFQEYENRLGEWKERIEGHLQYNRLIE